MFCLLLLLVLVSNSLFYTVWVFERESDDRGLRAFKYM